jgi:hypothetical protein
MDPTRVRNHSDKHVRVPHVDKEHSDNYELTERYMNPEGNEQFNLHGHREGREH